jgi:hypothetical protein
MRIDSTINSNAKNLSPGESNPALSRDRGRCYRYTREDFGRYQNLDGSSYIATGSHKRGDIMWTRNSINSRESM